jgi:phage terminase large subunit
MEATQLQNNFIFADTSATRKVFSLEKRIRAVAGGTSASKTISILVWLIDYSQMKQERDKVVHVVSESFPHLEMGAMEDFKNIMKDRGYWNDERWHGTQHTYTFETGNKIRFMSIDTFGKAHGPRRDVLFVNECNNLAYNIVDQLIARTRETVWLDWNPSEEFWFYTEMKPNRKDIDFITLTYKDNEALSQVMIDEIESHIHDKNWWTVYGLGQLGEIVTRIYRGWQPIEEVPYEARLLRRGLDFGYTNDPTAVIDIYEYNGGYLFDEQLYQKRLSNAEIAEILLALPEPQTLVMADSAEPKSIDELKKLGVNVIAAVKGQGSVNQGIAYVQSKKIWYTTRSVNLIKEFRNYVWITDKDGYILNTPVDFLNHLLDAIRYALSSYTERQKLTGELLIRRNIERRRNLSKTSR